MMPELPFELFDPEAEVAVSERQLPHWFQPGVITFVTFRTADSIPNEVLLRWYEELRDWLKQNGVVTNPDNPIPTVESLPPALQGPYRRQRFHKWNDHLDNCHGECHLRKRDLAEIVLNSLRHFDGQRYELDSCIVMPNHVHLLAAFHLPTTCRGQSESWLHFTAFQINQRLKRKGEFWQGEPFDHLVRSPEQYLYLRKYIADNGTKAKLPPTDYLYWSR